MGYTKRQFVTKAFEKIGLASYVFDLTPEQLEAVMEDMDAMLALWDTKGIRLGYPLPGDPKSGDLDEATNVPHAANVAIFCNLAILIAPNFGKTPAPELKSIAKTSYDALAGRAAIPKPVQMRAMPAGAGNKFNNTEQPFTDPPVDNLTAGPDGTLDFE